MLFPSGNPFKYHEEILYLQPLIPPKRFDIFSHMTGGCSEGLGAFSFFFKQRSKRRSRCVQIFLKLYSIGYSTLVMSCPELATKLEALRSIVEVINNYFVIIIRWSAVKAT